jgi:hypothetical protein
MGSFATLGDVDSAIRGSLASTSLGIMQCKTTWNENAQVPMLWDLIYEAAAVGRSLSRVHVGSMGMVLASFGEFNYSFAAVPTQDKIKADHLPAKRVQHLSGGNYWLRKSEPNVAACVNEFPVRNFGLQIAATAARNLPGHIDSNLHSQPNLVDDFVALDF